MIELAKDEIYITYIRENTIFDKNKITTILTPTSINKPTKAFWGSPINATFGWKEWCIREDFGNYDWENPIKWKLEKNSKILKIDWCDLQNNIELLKKYINIPIESQKLGFRYFMASLDFNKLFEDNIIAVQLLDGSIGHRFTMDIEMMFNSWDCESIVVLDETKIEFL